MKNIKIYTDGASSKNGSPEQRAGYGVVIVEEGSDCEHAISGSGSSATNQQMEIFACTIGLLRTLELFPEECYVEVYSDSAYVVNCINQGWYIKWQTNGWLNAKGQPVANKRLWEGLLIAIDAHPGFVSFHKVSGHSGNFYNELADRLARGGINRETV